MANQLSAQIRADIELEVAAKRDEIGELGERVRLREIELKNRAAQLESEISQRMEVELNRARVEANEAAERALDEKLAGSEKEISQLREKLKESQKAELELQSQRRELQDRAEALELEVARQVNEERSHIRKKALEDADEQHRLTMAEKEVQIQGLCKKIDELKRKAEQGSQQLQGEVQEEALEENLRRSFPSDTVKEVGKGMRGADCIQDVASEFGVTAGQIIWESKRTKAWSDEWIEKLRDDQRTAGADVAVIVTQTLPKGVERFAFVNGVWVTDWSSIIPLATALRHTIQQLFASKRSSEGRQSKIELLYEYMCGPSFRLQIEAIVEAFDIMQKDLQAEKRAITKHWAKREKQLSRMLDSTVSMYGDLQAIAGSSIPSVEALEMKHLESIAV